MAPVDSPTGGVKCRFTMIPPALVRTLSSFVIEHYACRGLHIDPEGMGEVCELLGKSWALENASAVSVYDETPEHLMVWAGRWGKHLGAFLANERTV